MLKSSKIFFLAFVIFALTIIPLKAFADKIMVRAGTLVEVTTLEQVTTASHRVGDRVLIAVTKDVLVDGKVVIAKGSPVFAEVIGADKANYAGISGEIALNFRTVKAVDDQSIILSGARTNEGDDKYVESFGGALCCPLFLLMKGDEAIIKSGTIITAHVALDAEIEVK